MIWCTFKNVIYYGFDLVKSLKIMKMACFTTHYLLQRKQFKVVQDIYFKNEGICFTYFVCRYIFCSRSVPLPWNHFTDQEYNESFFYSVSKLCLSFCNFSNTEPTPNPDCLAVPLSCSNALCLQHLFLLHKTIININFHYYCSNEW